MDKTEKSYTSDAITQNVSKIVKENLPKKLKTFRSMSGMTTNEVGELVDKNPSTVTLWEKGKALPDIGTLFKLRNIYKIPDLNDFFDLAPLVDSKQLSKSEQELIELWRRSPADVRASIKNLLKHCNK